MRQVAQFLKIIHRAELIDFYNSILSYGTIHGAKLPSLNEFLGSNLQSSETSNFDPETDKAMEAIALKRLEEKRRELGK